MCAPRNGFPEFRRGAVEHLFAPTDPALMVKHPAK
jgi:hypothetical protein